MFFFLYSLLLALIWPVYFCLSLIHPRLREFRHSRKEGAQALANFLATYKKKFPKWETSSQESSSFGLGRLHSASKSPPPIYWLHGSSVGEIDQALALARSIRKEKPKAVLLLSAFSLSVGRKEIEGIDLFFYLSLDFSQNWRRIWKDAPLPCAFVSMTWDVFPNLLRYLSKRSVPAYLCSASLSEKSWRLRSPWRWLLRPVYACFSGIGTVDTENQNRFASLHPKPALVKPTGDSRFDTIFYKIENASLQPNYVAWLRSLKYPARKGKAGKNQILILASTYRTEEEMFIPALPALLEKYPKLQILIFPHRIDATHISQIELLLQHSGIFYLKYSHIRSAIKAVSTDNVEKERGDVPHEDSVLERTHLPKLRIEFKTAFGAKRKQPQKSRVFLMDCMGLLALTYQYSDLCYVGGGFGRRVHNVAEPAALGNAILTGPSIDWSGIALALEKQGLLVRSHKGSVLLSNLDSLLSQPQRIQQMGERARLFLESKRGASQRFYDAFLRN